MPIHQGPAADFPLIAIGDTELVGVYVGELPVWVPAAGSAAVVIILGPVREVGSPSQRRIVRCTIAGSPFPTWIRLEGVGLDPSVLSGLGYDEKTLQDEFNQQTGSRRIVEITLTQDIDNTPTDIPLNFRVRASNGRTQDSASFTTQFEQR